MRLPALCPKATLAQGLIGQNTRIFSEVDEAPRSWEEKDSLRRRRAGWTLARQYAYWLGAWDWKADCLGSNLGSYSTGCITSLCLSCLASKMGTIIIPSLEDFFFYRFSVLLLSTKWLEHSWTYIKVYTHAQSLSFIWLLCDPTDCSLPGSSVHGISQARILECVAISSSRVPSQPRDQTPIACDLAGRLFTTELPGKPHILILKHSITVSNCFNFTALLRCNSYIICTFTRLKCTVQWFLVYSPNCETI